MDNSICCNICFICAISEFLAASAALMRFSCSCSHSWVRNAGQAWAFGGVQSLQGYIVRQNGHWKE